MQETASEGDNFSIGERTETTISPSSQEYVITFCCRRELLLAAPPSEDAEHGGGRRAESASIVRPQSSGVKCEGDEDSGHERTNVHRRPSVASGVTYSPSLAPGPQKMRLFLFPSWERKKEDQLSSQQTGKGEKSRQAKEGHVRVKEAILQKCISL